MPANDQHGAENAKSAWLTSDRPQSKESQMQIDGGCHCGNIKFVFQWPGDAQEIPVRACSCTFCMMHGGTYTSHRESELSAHIKDPALVSKYRFGTRTAEFYVCSRCGAIPFVTSEIGGHLYAVVNVNTFHGFDRSRFQRATTDFDGEDSESRLDRRSKTWIPNVGITES